MIVIEERLRERYGKRIFESACFGPKKNAVFTLMKLEGEDGILAEVWSVQVVVLLPLRWRKGEDKEDSSVQYTEATAL